MVRLVLQLICCLAAVVNAITVQDKKISTAQIVGRSHGNDKISSHLSPHPKVTREAGVTNPAPSPTKFGFVPTRTASSYAAKAPRPKYFQHTYKVKDTTKREPPSYHTKYPSTQYNNGQQYYVPQKIAPVQQPDETVPYLQPELSTDIYSQQQYQPAQYYQQFDGTSISNGQYQQPTQQEYQQYETVQYVVDENVVQPSASGHQYPESNVPAAAPEYYQIQQYPEPAGILDSTVGRRGNVQYVMLVHDSGLAQYSQNAITSDLKYHDYAEYQAPATKSKFSSSSLKKYPATKLTVPKPSAYDKVPEYQYTSTYQNYKRPDYNQQQEIIINRHPKSLLDSYIPSVVQLKWLEQQKHAQQYSR